MNNEYKKPEISVVSFDNNDIIETSNELKAANFKPQVESESKVAFNNDWIDSYYPQ